MPPQRTFSNTDHSNRATNKARRHNWTRNHTHPAARASDGSKTKLAKPPLPISNITKNKLNAFQFAEQPKQEAAHLDNWQRFEDIATTEVPDGNQTTALMALPVLEERSTQICTQSPNHHLRLSTPSTTPAGKLAFNDLVSMADMRTPVSERSPDDRIMWAYDNTDVTSSISSYTGTKTSKRTRSSSPSSSPTYAPAHFPAEDVLKQSPKFNGLDGHCNNEKLVTRTSGISNLSRLLGISSPEGSRQMIVPKGKSTLRRSVTCGLEWPKRRRLATLDDTSAGASLPVANAIVTTKLSRISALLEKVHEEYVADEASSIAPEHSHSMMGSTSTSSQIQNAIQHLCVDGAASEVLGSNGTVKEQEPDNRKMTRGSSDYGDYEDGEFDATLVDGCQQIPTSAQAKSCGKEIPPTLLSAQQSNGMIESAIIPLPDQEASTKKVQRVYQESDDEFGGVDDMDEQLFEGIAAKFDTPSGNISALSNKLKSIPDQRRVYMETSDLEDEFGDDFDDIDFEAMESAVTQAVHQPTTSILPTTQKARAIQRYLVTDVSETAYINARGKQSRQKILLVSVEKTSTIKTIKLRDEWFDTPVPVKAYVHVIGDFCKPYIIVDNHHNMLILHPDHLISSTVVADSFSCIRRAVLQDRVKATCDTSEPLVYGTILHEIFQAAMLVNRWDSIWLAEAIEEIASRHLEELFVIKVQKSQAVKYLLSKMPKLQSWAEVFISSQVNSKAVLKANNNSGKATMCISKLLDVEEHVWSPMYGLKGNIDATVQVTIREGGAEQTLTVPFEVKTGKRSNAAHRAQTALYNLLLSDRYDVNVACGILYYMETSETIRIPAIRHEIRHMIMQRNELACFIRERHAQLPPMLKDSNMCGNCYAKEPCFIYSKFADNGSGETTGLKQKFDDIVKHLTPKHREFFMKWDDLLTKEEKESMKFRRELWTMLGTEREKVGRCFSNVVIEPGSVYENKSTTKINRFEYTMIKPEYKDGFSFQDSQMTAGEPIVISDEAGHFALANGYVTKVDKWRIAVVVDRRLHNARVRKQDFHDTHNQVFTGTIDLTGIAEDTVPRVDIEAAQSPTFYRLDKDEFSNGLATVRNNLIQLMSDVKVGSRTIRSLVVDLEAPRFKLKVTDHVLQSPSSINIDQRRAISKVMTAHDYALILGMPGTGKTTTIAHIIRALISQGKSVLLTSYTHTAVDNILMKLRDDKIPILRLGAAAKIHPEVQDFVRIASEPMQCFEDIQSAWHGSPVVATTCLGINHPIFRHRTFDYCIVDEASQITLPVCLGPIQLAQTFVLVGDHYQLPPLVQNEEARTGGLDTSLFKLLSDKHPSAVVNLEHQYRMCADIMTLSNELIYSGRLKCGTPQIATRSIHIPNMDGLEHLHKNVSSSPQQQRLSCASSSKGHCWIRGMLDPAVKVQFLNTDNIPSSYEEKRGNRIVNHTEARVVKQLVKSFLSVGIAASCIGIMTHYRSQLSILKECLSSHRDIEMHTADRFQGRDKEIIILSLVRSNENGSIGELLKDWRRINVAITRAKTKLLIVGSRSTLNGSVGSEEMVAKFVRLMEYKDWVFDLPVDALELHSFEEGSTQCSGRTSRHALSQSHCLAMSLSEDARSRKGALNTTRDEHGRVEECKRAVPKKAEVGQRALLAGRPILKDITRELANELQV